MSGAPLLPVLDRLRRGEVLVGYETSRPSTSQPVGFPLSGARPLAPERALFAPDESHLITIAPNGAGKGRSALIPTLLTYPGTCVVIDPKGEALEVTRRYRQTLGEVVVLDPFGESAGMRSSFNPFDALGAVPGGVEVAAQEIKDLLLGARKSSREAFWDDKAGSLLAGILAYAIGVAPEGKRHLGEVYRLLHSDDAVYSLAVLLDTMPDISPLARGEIAAFLQTVEVTRSGILSTAQRYIDILATPEVQTALETTSFDLDAFASGETMTIYLVLPPSKLDSFGPLLRLWLGALFLLILYSRRSRPEIATLTLIDEAAQLGTMDLLRKVMTLYRYKGIRAWTFWQDPSQLTSLYPNDWPTIFNNARVAQAFGVSMYPMAKTLAAMMHEKKLAAEDFLALGAGEQIALLPGGNVHFARRPDYLTDSLYQGRFDANSNYEPPPARD